MRGVPDTKYARNGDVHIAYQVLGDGPIDLLFATSYVSHLEFMWENERIRYFNEQLADFSRLILFDKRGTGLSDPLAGEVTLEERVDDMRAVMKAAGSEQAALFGTSEGATLAAMLAATTPESCLALIAYSPFVTGRADEESPWGWTDEQWEQFLDVWHAEDIWRSAEVMENVIKSTAEAQDLVEEAEWYVRYWRASASPAAVRQLMAANKEIDIRPVLRTIRVPTLVMQRKGEVFIPVDYGRYMADAIPGARFVLFEGTAHYPWLENADEVIAEVREFLTGSRGPVATDRVLGTVLFTDLVSSTERAAELGDAEWRRLLDRHDELVARQAERFRGNLIKTTGDGVLATFDGPARAVQCGRAILEAIQRLDLVGRAGVHTGEIELRGSDIGGIAVNLGRRICDAAESGQILASNTVKDLVFGSGLEFEDYGEHELKGVPGRWQLYAVRP
jgi:pimeloyl-ACP methyl ester carboxylesterase/plasmid stabilization system protein ParE